MIDESCYTAYMKEVTKKLEENGADQGKIDSFKKGVQEYWTKKIKPNFDDFDFYLGESLDPKGMQVLHFRRLSVPWAMLIVGLIGLFCSITVKMASHHTS